MPAWMAAYATETVQCFLNHPTLEPAITDGNEALVADALTSVGIAVPDPVTPSAIDELFHAGARSRKGEFAVAMAGAIRDAVASGSPVNVPASIDALFSYLYVDAQEKDEPIDAAIPAD